MEGERSMRWEEQGAAGRYAAVPRTLTFLLRGDEVLLLRGAPGKGRWARRLNGIGGHVEPGESVLAGALREVREETGLDAVVFGSAALVRAWRDLGLGLPKGTVPVAWGKVCAGAVREVLGQDPLILAEPTLEALAATLADLNEKNKRRH